MQQLSDGKPGVIDAAAERWRWALLALCGLGFFFIAVNIYTDTHLNADIGLRGERTHSPLLDRAVVTPGSDAARSGLQTGDLIDATQLDPAARFRIYDVPRRGEPIVFPLQRGSAHLNVTVVPRNVPPVRWSTWLLYAGQVWIALFCTFLAWRRWSSGAARALILYLLLTLVVAQGFGDISTPWPWFDYACLCIKGLLFPLGVAFVALYAGQFAPPVSIVRRGLTFLAFALVALGWVLAQWYYFSVTRGQVDPFVELLLIRASPQYRFTFVALALTALLALATAIRASQGAERTRLLWGIWGIAPFLTWGIVAAVAGAAIPFVVFTIVAAIFWFATPAILTYSLLNRRLFDIGFIVNRAAVFTGVSIVVLGTFTLVEWLVSDWLRDASHTTNLLVSGGLALALGLSIRAVHGRVDRAVDNVFFRQRHEDEQAIRTFAHEAAYIGDPEILLERATAVLEDHTNAASIEIVLHYDENDPAIVRMRAFPQPLDLHGLPSSLHGDVAFPMVARGRFVGAVVLGARTSGETYAPDEVSAISLLAHNVASALDALGSRNGDSGTDRIIASIEALRAEIVRRLPPVQSDTVA